METMTLTAAAVAGILLGVFYFGGLWWTVRRLTRVRHPLNLYFGSVALRLAVALLLFYAVLANYDAPALVASLVGFFSVRVALARIAGDGSLAQPSARKPR